MCSQDHILLTCKISITFEKSWDKNYAKKCAQEQVIQDTNELQETDTKALSANKSQKSSSSSQIYSPVPLQRSLYPIQNRFATKPQDSQQDLGSYARPYTSADGGGEIYRNNKADLDMTIMELSHAKSIPFNIGESDRFRKVIT